MNQDYPQEPGYQTYRDNESAISAAQQQRFAASPYEAYETDAPDPLYEADAPDPSAYQTGSRPEQPPDPSPKGRFSRRKLLIAGAAGGGLVVATSLGIVELGQFLQKQNADVLGSFLLGNARRHSVLDAQPPFTTLEDIVIFSDRLSQGWSDWSWGGKHPIVASPAFTDGTRAYQYTPANYNGFYLSHKPINTTGFGFFQFWINGGSVGGQQISAGLVDQTYAFLAEPNINSYIQGGFIQLNKWQLVRIPLADLQGADTNIGGIIIRDVTGTAQPNVFLADLRLVHIPDPNEPVLLSGDAPDLNAILLFFNRQMRPDEVQAAQFYQVSSLEDARYMRPIHPASAQYHPTSKSVSLFVPSSMLEGKSYLVSVGRIHANDGPAALPDASSVQVMAHSLELSIDISQRGPQISQYIYGVGVAPSEAYMADLRPKVNRWGGTQTIRYNWKLGNAFNAGIDYHFENGNYGYTSAADRQPSGVVDQFIGRNKGAGVDSYITIPNIGWVAKDDLATSYSINAGQGAPPIKPGSDITIKGYDPTANRLRTSVPSRARKGSPLSDPPNLSDRTVAQDEWVYHLTRHFGAAGKGGPRFYGMDNEPEIWEYIEHDIRPAQISYEQMRDIFLDYASAVKSVDPAAMVTAPIIAVWTNFFYSSLDRGLDNFKTKADFHAHHDTFFIPWWLDQLRQHDKASGQRTLDVLDVHFFPQATGVYYSAKTDASGRELRLRSTRALWDKTYKDESWIHDYTYLIPRMQDWIQQNYPGTKFGISEYSWGAEKTMNGGLAQAEVLGIYGRYGVYLACYWASPPTNSPVYNAFKLYSNYDGKGAWFGGTSIQATSTNADRVSCYASEQDNGDVLLMVLNKDEQEALTPTIHLPHIGSRQITAYRCGPDTNEQIAQVGTLALSSETLRYTFPPYSITLLKMSKA